MAPSLKLYGLGTAVEKVLLTARFAGVEVSQEPFTAGITNKTPWYLAMNSAGKWPVLQTPSGHLSESNAICKYVASVGKNATLYPLPTSPEVSAGHARRAV